MQKDEVIFKEYVESTKQFHFGPLQCGKSREWYVLPAGPCTLLDMPGETGCPVAQSRALSWETHGLEGPQMCELEPIRGK